MSMLHRAVVFVVFMELVIRAGGMAFKIFYKLWFVLGLSPFFVLSYKNIPKKYLLQSNEIIPESVTCLNQNFSPGLLK